MSKRIFLVTRSAITGGVEEHVSQLAKHLVNRKRAVLWVVLSKMLSYSEGMSLSILEAMAAGLPVIDTHVGGIPEAVIYNVTGYLIRVGDYLELAEKLEKLYRDDEKRRTFGATGRNRVKEFFDRKNQLISIIDHY